MSGRSFYRLLPNIAVLVSLVLLVVFWSSASATSENKLVNGSFSSTSGGWQGANGGASCLSGQPSLGLWQENAVTFSYIHNTITQQVIVDDPSELLLTFDAVNRPESYINGQIEVAISGPQGTVTTGEFVPPRTPSQFSLGYQTMEPNEILTISISGDDNGLFWAGCYGPSVTSASLVAVSSVPEYGLNTEVYTIDNGDYTFTASGRALCPGAITYIENLSTDWGGGIVANCRNDAVMIRYYGSITVPGEAGQTIPVTFMNITDDGHKLIINEQTVIDDWGFKACSGQTQTVELIAGEKYPYESWFFEAGGGACDILYWSVNGTPMEIIPPSAFTPEVVPVVTPTTTTSTTTTSTVPETTTTTTTLPETTTTTLPETTTTTSTLPETTTTTSTLPETTTTSTSTTTIPENTTTTEPVIETTTTIEPVIETTTTTEQPVETTTTTIPEEPVEELPQDIEEILGEGITPDEAAAAASSPELLEQLSSSEASEVFSAIEVSELTEEEAAAIVEAVQSAPTSVRKAFENTIDVYGGKFDDYVMVNSKINIGDRRTIVAVTVVGSITAMAATTMQPPSGGGFSGGSGGSSGGGSGQSGPGTNSRTESDDEEEQEPAGEIAGDGVDWISGLSIYEEINGEKVMNWRAFIKKFLFGIMNLGFTISGSIVVYFTLSGTIQKIALVSTLAAFAAAMYLHMYEPKDD